MAAAVVAVGAVGVILGLGRIGTLGERIEISVHGRVDDAWFAVFSPCSPPMPATRGRCGLR